MQAAVVPPQPMHKWLRVTTLRFFSRQNDSLHVTQVIEFSQDLPRRILAAGYEAVSRDTYFISLMAREILVQHVSGEVYQEDEIFKAEKVIALELDKAHEFFDTRIVQSQRKMETAGYAPDLLKGRPTKYSIDIYTSSARGYMEVCLKADHYLRLLSGLELIGELSDRADQAIAAKKNTEREAKNVLMGVAKTINTQYSIINRICRGAIEKRREERAATAEKDRQKHRMKVEAEAKRNEKFAKDKGRLAKAQGELGANGPLGKSKGRKPEQVV